MSYVYRKGMSGLGGVRRSSGRRSAGSYVPVGRGGLGLIATTMVKAASVPTTTIMTAPPAPTTSYTPVRATTLATTSPIVQQAVQTASAPIQAAPLNTSAIQAATQIASAPLQTAQLSTSPFAASAILAQPISTFDAARMSQALFPSNTVPVMPTFPTAPNQASSGGFGNAAAQAAANAAAQSVFGSGGGDATSEINKLRRELMDMEKAKAAGAAAKGGVSGRTLASTKGAAAMISSTQAQNYVPVAPTQKSSAVTKIAIAAGAGLGLLKYLAFI